MNPVSAFISHSFVAAPEYVGLLDMFERQGIAFVNRSVPAWNPLDATGTELAAALEHRIQASARVIVLATQNLHKSPSVRFEIEVARKHGKPIVAIYPNGEFGNPIPKVLDASLYRAIGWRGNALEKALRGEYPPESRVFDLAEDAQVRSVVRFGVAASAGAAFLMAGATRDRVAILRRELEAGGVVVPPLQDPPVVAYWAIGGALLGLFVEAVLGGKKGGGLIAGAVVGGALGTGVGLVKLANAELRQLGPLLELRRVQPSLVTINEVTVVR